MKAVIYARKSTEDKKKQVHSIGDQLNILRKIAKDRGLEVAKEITEERSAKDLGRPGFGQLTALLYEKKATVVLTWALDRLARNQADGGQLTHMVQTGLIEKIITPEQEYDRNTSALLLAVKFGMANEFIIDLSRGVKRGMKSRLEQGYYTHKAPFGYRSENKECVPDHRASIIKDIFDKYDSGQYSIKQLVDLIERKYGIKVYKSMVNRYLRNSFYYGVMVSGGESYQGRHKPLVGKDLFDRVQDRLEGKKQPMTQRRFFIFTRLIQNEKRKLVGYERKGHVYYRRSDNQAIEVQQGKKVVKQVSESYLIDLVFTVLGKTQWHELFHKVLARVYEIYTQGQVEVQVDTRKEFIRQLSVLDKKLQRIKNKFWDSESLSEVEFNEQKSKISKERRILLQQLEAKEIDQDENFVSTVILLQNFTKMNLDQFGELCTSAKRELIQVLFENIELEENRLSIVESSFYKNMVDLNELIKKQKIEPPKIQSITAFDGLCYQILKDGARERTGIELLKSLSSLFKEHNIYRTMKKIKDAHPSVRV